MSQYGGPKPPVWGARPTGMPTNAGLYAGQLTAGQLGMGLNAINPGMMNLGGMVNQAAFGAPQGMGLVGMNPLAAAQARQQPQQSVQTAPAPAQQMASKNQRTFIGRVTKMHDNYGFVDEDVFFQASVVRGTLPRTGDRVMVEASYNAAMPFKWNAYRVQVMNDGVPQQQQPVAPAFVAQPQTFPAKSTRETTGGRQTNWGPPEGGRTSVPQRTRSPVQRRSSPRRSPPRRTSPRRSPLRNRSPKRSERTTSPKKREVSRERKEPREERKRERERSPPTRTGSAVPSRRDSTSPPRRRQRIIPRYVCNMPKNSPMGMISAACLKKRYASIYVPSDFCEMRVDWSSMPPNQYIDMAYPAHFHVLPKEVDPLETLPELEPSDADHRYQVKVLLLSHAGRAAINQKAFGLAKDGNLDESYEPVDLFKTISFLVGCRNKEMVPLGGSYSPSLDGQDPLSMGTMIRTATRCVKALTGLDLSNAAQWFQLGQLRYYRADKDRADRVTLLIPSSGELQPTDERFATYCDALRSQLGAKMNALEAPISETLKEIEPTTATTPTVIVQESPAPAVDPEMEEGEEPTHWSKLDVKTMKVVELRSELAARGLDSKGIKTLLVQRLEEALIKEKEADGGMAPEEPAKEEKKENGDETKAPTEERKEGIKPAEETEEQKKAREDEERKKKEQAEKERAEKKASLEKKYALPTETKAFVFPNRDFKAGKFDCKVVNLKTLLDYRQEDNKEHQFEVSLYAEALRELTERHYAYVISTGIARAGERDEERKRRDDAYKPETQEEEKNETKIDTEENGLVDLTKDDDDKKDEKKEKKLDLKANVHNTKLFEAFAFFDSNLLGYLQEGDFEEILSITRLGFNRSVIKKLSSKWARHEKISYRSLTDQLLDKDGNPRFVPSSDEGSALLLMIGGFIERLGDEVARGNESFSGDGGVVMVNGCAINVEQKLGEIKRLENEKEAAVTKYAQAETTIKTLKETRDHLEKRKKRLEDDVDRYRRKAHDAEKSLKSAHDDSAGARTALIDAKKVAEKLLDVIVKGLPEEKKKEEKKEEKEVKPVENGTKTPILVEDEEMELADSVGEELPEKKEDEIEEIQEDDVDEESQPPSEQVQEEKQEQEEQQSIDA